MPFTREYIRGLAKECGIEMPKEFEDSLVAEHIAARDAYVEKQLEDHKPEKPIPVKDTDEYKNLKKQFEDFKTDTARKETAAAKEKVARAYFTGKNITGKNQEIALRACRAELDAAELDGEKFKDCSALDALVAGDMAGLVGETKVQGAQKHTPPKNDPPAPEGPKNLAEALREKYQKG